MPEIIKVKHRKKPQIKKRRVAAYCRVSTLQESQQGSYDLQIRYFNKRIMDNPEWEFSGIFTDHGISGTGTSKRVGFQKMLQACEEGKIDLILTKSIKRFARNTVDLLNTIRHLKELNIEVLFENENISTFSKDGDFMLTILASFAQEESRSLSGNLKWAVKKKFEQGEAWTKPDCLGYHWDGEQYQLVEDQASTVKRIFDEFLSGETMADIANRLNQEEVPKLRDDPWTYVTIANVLRNISYTGNLVLQKFYKPDPFVNSIKKNKGEMDQYFVPETHQPIISMEDFETVQSMLTSRAPYQEWSEKQPFAGLVICAKCKHPYYHHHGYWDCKSRVEKWKRGSDNEITCPAIPTYALEEAVCKALKVEHIDTELCRRKVESIAVNEDRTLTVSLIDGMKYSHVWQRRWRLHDEATCEQFAKEYVMRDTNPWAKKRGDLCCFIKCGTCNKNYVRNEANKAGDHRFRTRCKHQKPFWESEMKLMIADVLGLEEYDVTVQDEAMTHCVVDGDYVTFYFRDGTTETRYFHG